MLYNNLNQAIELQYSLSSQIGHTTTLFTSLFLLAINSENIFVILWKFCQGYLYFLSIYGEFLLSIYLFIYLGFYVTFNTVQVISRWVVGRAEETSAYSLLVLLSRHL